MRSASWRRRNREGNDPIVTWPARAAPLDDGRKETPNGTSRDTWPDAEDAYRSRLWSSASSSLAIARPVFLAGTPTSRSFTHWPEVVFAQTPPAQPFRMAKCSTSSHCSRRVNRSGARAVTPPSSTAIRARAARTAKMIAARAQPAQNATPPALFARSSPATPTNAKNDQPAATIQFVPLRKTRSPSTLTNALYPFAAATPRSSDRRSDLARREFSESG
jgi:hypothetical protein